MYFKKPKMGKQERRLCLLFLEISFLFTSLELSLSRESWGPLSVIDISSSITTLVLRVNRTALKWSEVHSVTVNKRDMMFSLTDGWEMPCFKEMATRDVQKGKDSSRIEMPAGVFDA